MPSPKSKIGLVLPAGGARAAYQVGVLKYLAEKFPACVPTIFSGISAGSINACYLAQGDAFPSAVENLTHLWEEIRFDDVLKTNFKSLFSVFTRWACDLILSRATHEHRVKSLLDASPLAETLLSHIHFWKISRALRSGQIDGVSVSATNYHNGSTTIFFDSHLPLPAWHREQRQAVRTPLRVKHVMASCSIPLLFEPIRIGEYLYGDGSLRFSFPLSPAIHLGATKLLCIGIRCPAPENPLGTRPTKAGIGFVAGAVLNSIFLDSLEADYETFTRMNEYATGEGFRRIPSIMIRPSRDLGALAKDYIEEVPFHFKRLLLTTAKPEEVSDLLSYLLFAKGYVKALMALGYEDAKSRHQDLETFASTP